MNLCTLEVDPVVRLRDEAGKLLVRRAIERNDWIAETICDIAAGDRADWSTLDWAKVLQGLKQTELRVADWLDLNT